MTYDIYFHDDFDGYASAAVVFSFLKSRGDTVAHFTPLTFDMFPAWLDEKFFEKHKLFRGKRNPAIVVDFPYHPAAAIWFDHHPTTFKKESWRRAFTQTPLRRFAPKYLSCCHLAYDSFKKKFDWRPPTHFTDLVRWLDVIDAARYASARQTIEMKEPALQIDQFIYAASYRSGKAEQLVKLIAEKPLPVIARRKEVQRIVRRLRKEHKHGMEFYKKNVQIIDRTAFIDFTAGGNRIRCPRFTPNYFFPKLLYAARVQKKDSRYGLGVSVNPWLRSKNKIHIGEALQKYGGGGHKDVGGAEFIKKSDAMLAASAMIVLLNKKAR